MPVVTPASPLNPVPAGGTKPGVAPGRRRAALAAFVLIYVTMQVASYTQKSATYDEPMHLAAGYAALARQDHRIDPTHPPLVRMWAALPLLGMPEVDIDTTEIDRLDPFAWMSQNYSYTHDFLFQDRDADHLLDWARFMVVLLGVGLGLLLFRWVEAWFGFPLALLVLGFYLLSPNLGAHAALVTTDLGVTCFYFGACYFLWQTSRRFTAGNIAGLALCFAAAMVTKFSAILLVPAVALLLAWAAARGEVLNWRRAAGLALLLAATTWVLIWAVYGFRYAPSDTPGWLFETRHIAAVQDRLPVLAPLLDAVDHRHLLPNAYTQGFLVSISSSEMLPAYLAGAIRPGGWWYYFPVAFLVKTPAVLLILLAAGLGLLVVRRRALGPANVAFVLVPPAVFLVGAMATDINIGLRHILPVYPFALVIAIVAVREILATAWRWRTKLLLLGPLAALWIATFTAVYPHTLTFFNLFVGGPRHGGEFLADSNLDWGQHLKLLKKWMDRHGVARVNLAYFGMGDPAYYGVKGVLLPGTRDFLSARIAKPELPGYVVISATVLSGAYLAPEWRLFYSGFEHLTPVAVLGNTLHVYRVDHWPEPTEEPDPTADEDEIMRQALLGDGLLHLEWYDHAIHHYREYLRLRPDSAPAHAALGEALFATRQLPGAVEEFREAARLNPAATLIRTRFAEMLIEQGDWAGAVADLKSLIAQQPDIARAYDVLGTALVHGARLADAEAAFRQARELEPDDAVIRKHLELVRQARRGGLAPGARPRR